MSAQSVLCLSGVCNYRMYRPQICMKSINWTVAIWFVQFDIAPVLIRVVAVNFLLRVCRYFQRKYFRFGLFAVLLILVIFLTQFYQIPPFCDCTSRAFSITPMGYNTFGFAVDLQWAVLWRLQLPKYHYRNDDDCKLQI